MNAGVHAVPVQHPVRRERLPPIPVQQVLTTNADRPVKTVLRLVHPDILRLIPADVMIQRPMNAVIPAINQKPVAPIPVPVVQNTTQVLMPQLPNVVQPAITVQTVAQAVLLLIPDPMPQPRKACCSDTCSSGSTSSSCSSGYSPTVVGYTECGSTCYSCVKDDPCDNYTSKTCTYGCSAYYSDCSTKCQTCYSDNCHNRTAVSCSYGCDSYYSDCSSKCQTCASCTYSTECSGYSVPSLSKCECGGQSCTACGTTKYKCNSNCLPDLVEDTCSTLGHPTCTDAVPYVVGSCCCPTSTQTSTYNCDCCVSEVQ